MNHLNSIIKKIVTDHHTAVFTGIMLFMMGLINLFDNLFEKVLGISYNISYGFIFMGAFNILLAIAFIIMGTANVEAGIAPENDTQKDDEICENRIYELEKRITELEKIITDGKK